MQQLDIFADSHDRVLINRLAEALCDGALAQSEQALAELSQTFPDDRHLGSAAVLVQTLAQEQAQGQALSHHSAAAQACEQLAGGVSAAALRVLGADAAKPWLAQRWQALARRARALPFDSETGPEHSTHAAALWLQGRAWAEAEQAASAIDSWRRKPAPLAWVAQARWHLQGLDATWPLLAELAWIAPARLGTLLPLLPDAALHKLARGFEGAGIDTPDDKADWPDWRWWPAWLLVEQPLLSAPLQAAQTDAVAPPEVGFKLVLALLRAERQGRQHDLIALRRQVQALHPALFKAYMATR